MDQALVGGVIGASIQVLVQNLLSVSIDVIKLLGGYNKDLTKLKYSLQMIQAYLSDAEKVADNSAAIRLWLERLEDVAYEADEVLDTISYELLRVKVESRNQEAGTITSFFSSVTSNSFFQLKMNSMISDVNNKLESINEEAKCYGLQMLVAGAHHRSVLGTGLPDERQTDSVTLEPHFVGRENDITDIVKMLVTAPAAKTISVLPIVGMGGLGKTTIARKIFNHEHMSTHFGEKIWVCVSADSGAVNLLRMILQSLTKGDVQVPLNREVMLQKIFQYVQGKRYLLVLDDVWNDESDKWEDFINSLSGISSVEGNAILVTTRMTTVASLVKTLPIYSLNRLLKDDCWSIIRSKSLVGDGSTEFDNVGKDIAETCGGLPLAAQVVGSLLHGKSKDEWLSFLQNELSQLGQDEKMVWKILKLSYDRLPSVSLKMCFSYCSIFAKDSILERVELIEYWMAEGLLQADHQRNEMEVVGNKYFNHLLQHSLLQEPVRDDFGNIEHCKMHDLVHDVASSVSRVRSINMQASDSNDMDQVQYVSLNSSTVEPYVVPREQSQSLRTIFIHGKFAQLMLFDFKCLHALTLEGGVIRELPTEIGKLIHLRLLKISRTKIRSLPDSIGKLYHLQTLKIDMFCFLESLPSTISDLIHLRHLCIPYIKLPPGIGKLTSLQTLPFYDVGCEEGSRIGELGKLKNLRGVLKIYNLENVNGKKEAEDADLFGKPNIFKLGLFWNIREEGEINDENVLEGLVPHPNLKSLEIVGYKGRHFPLWIMKMSSQNGINSFWVGFNNLTKLSIAWCDQCEEIPMLGHLPRLKSLGLIGLSNVKSIGQSFYGFESCITSSLTSSNVHHPGTIISFPALEILTLDQMTNLVEWMDVEGATAVFPCLKELIIATCPKLKSVPSHFSSLEILVIHRVDSNFSLENIWRHQTCLKTVSLYSLPGLVNLPDRFLVKNKNLSSLVIHDCSNLTHLVPCLPCDGSSLSNLSNDRPKLQKLKIKGCERVTDLPSETIAPFASSLGSLTLSGLKSLVNLTTLISCLSRMSCLTSLKLVNLPLINLPMEISCLSSLQELGIGRFSNSLDLDLFNDYLRRIFQEGHWSLRSLLLYGQDDWVSLPDQIQHLTALRHLKLENFGIEALPEWLGNLSSLEQLKIYNCIRLDMPSYEAMKCFTKLSCLICADCPLIENWYRETVQGGGEYEWSYIGSYIKLSDSPYKLYIKFDK